MPSAAVQQCLPSGNNSCQRPLPFGQGAISSFTAEMQKRRKPSVPSRGNRAKTQKTTMSLAEIARVTGKYYKLLQAVMDINQNTEVDCEIEGRVVDGSKVFVGTIGGVEAVGRDRNEARQLVARGVLEKSFPDILTVFEEGNSINWLATSGKRMKMTQGEFESLKVTDVKVIVNSTILVGDILHPTPVEILDKLSDVKYSGPFKTPIPNSKLSISVWKVEHKKLKFSSSFLDSPLAAKQAAALGLLCMLRPECSLYHELCTGDVEPPQDDDEASFPELTILKQKIREAAASKPWITATEPKAWKYDL